MADLKPAQDQLPASSHAERVKALTSALLEAEAAGAGVQLQTAHTHAPGLVARTIFIPAGTVLTGARHRQGHINVVWGDISVATDEGVQRLVGYHVLAGKPGVERAGLAHRDTWWTSIHLNPTDTTDVDEIEDMAVEDADQLQRRRLAQLEG